MKDKDYIDCLEGVIVDLIRVIHEELGIESPRSIDIEQSILKIMNERK